MKKFLWCVIMAYVYGLHARAAYDRLLEYRKSPYVKAFLDTIAYAEDTLYRDSYRAQYPGITFNSFHDHPRTKHGSMLNGKYIRATAAGRYMFLQKTWDDIAPRIGAKNFSPINQDRAAIALIERRGVLKDILQGKFEPAVRKLNTTWATFPGAPYGQPTKKMSELKAIFNERLQFYMARS